MNYLERKEIVDVLRDCLDVAKARREQYRANLLPLRGAAQDGQSVDVIAGLRNGQIVALSATFVQELVNHMGLYKHHQEVPTAPKIRARIGR